MPTRTLSDAQLADLELLLSGALAPLGGFMTAADVAAVADSWQLSDGTPFPVPVTLDVPAGAVPEDTPYLALADPEGTPLAVLRITERVPLPGSGAPGSGAPGSGVPGSGAPGSGVPGTGAAGTGGGPVTAAWSGWPGR